MKSTQFGLNQLKIWKEKRKKKKKTYKRTKESECSETLAERGPDI